MAEVDRATDALPPGSSTDGFSPGDRLAVYLQNVPQFVLAMLATWKAGGTMVSINPMNKARELEYLLTDSGATMLVTPRVAVRRRRRDGRRRKTGVRDGDHHERARLPRRRPARALRRHRREPRPTGTARSRRAHRAHDGARRRRPTLAADDVAFLTYTSGTTGPPKGAMNTHRNVVFNSAGLPRLDVARRPTTSCSASRRCSTSPG